MASNINKAFMRAYAKDRQANPEPAAAAPMVPPAAATQPGVTPQAIPVVTPQKGIERLARPAISTPAAAPPQVTRAPAAKVPTGGMANPLPPPAPRMYSVPRASQAVHPASQQTQSPPTTRAAVARHGAANTPQNTAAGNARSTVANKVPAAAGNATSAVTSAAAPSVNSAGSHSDDPSTVWRRIDAAHSQQVRHPANNDPRTSVAVSVGAAPKRMQATAKAPAAPSTAPIARPQTQPPQEALPLLSNESSAAIDSAQLESRRRTVADFLYAAGQYNPGRLLSGQDSGLRAATSSGLGAATQSPAMTSVASPMMASTPVSSRQVEAAREMVSSTTHAGPVVESNVPLAASHGEGVAAYPSSPLTAPTTPPSVAAPSRRMGQILRVDVPRGSASVAVPANPSVRAPAAEEPESIVQPAVSSAAQYVLEQRRIDRAHQLNEAEEQLRTSAHHTFNPVWEVDNLQWPSVVDKLMQQRAESMAHVAAHLKTACQDGLSVLGVTSAEKGEGRTTVACCLARLAAAHGLSVALVDLDLDHPTLCIQTNIEVERDWRDCLNEELELEEVAVHSLEDQLTILALKPRGGRPGLLASDSRIADMLRQLSDCFELVVVDCSNTRTSGNVITGLAHTEIFDAAIVVVDRRNPDQERIEEAVRQVQQTGIESIGIVDNFSA